jgi:hypothetical protein
MFWTLFYLSIAGCTIGSISHGSAKADVRGVASLIPLLAVATAI